CGKYIDGYFRGIFFDSTLLEHVIHNELESPAFQKYVGPCKNMLEFNTVYRNDNELILKRILNPGDTVFFLLKTQKKQFDPSPFIWDTGSNRYLDYQNADLPFGIST
ncbi:hypothetical protein RZS08_36005, partial [Arthrospira platensis SPKY1]|nr:hypothetical protein [Arthrospira platensis SPKY1]